VVIGNDGSLDDVRAAVQRAWNRLGHPEGSCETRS
jgi:hypothetical protein